MIKTLIFDFGDVFINLDKEGALSKALDLFEIPELDNGLLDVNLQYEKGEISTDTFIEFYLKRFPNCSKDDLTDTWNCILKDFPFYRLEFLEKLKSETSYQLILLSNTNEMHIDCISSRVSFYRDFKLCFDQFYLSHQIQMRKPDTEIFDFVLTSNKLNANECLFIDDTKENTDAAESLGIYTWNIDETTEDVVNLFSVKSNLF